jgi:hypothetical protein
LQACYSSQQQLLHLQNLISHTALQTCLTEQQREAYAAAVQAFAPAVLKVRSSGKRSRATAKGNRNMELSSTSGAAAAAVAEATASHLIKPSGYSLLQHLQTLAVAAQETSRLTQQVSCLARALLPE